MTIRNAFELRASLALSYEILMFKIKTTRNIHSTNYYEYLMLFIYDNTFYGWHVVDYILVIERRNGYVVRNANISSRGITTDYSGTMKLTNKNEV